MQDRREESPWLSPATYSLLYHRSKSVDAQECLARGKAGRWVGAAAGSCTQCWGLAWILPALPHVPP